MSVPSSTFLRHLFHSLRGTWHFSRTMGIDGASVRGSAQFQECKPPPTIIQQHFATTTPATAVAAHTQNASAGTDAAAATSTTTPTPTPAKVVPDSSDLVCLHYSEEGEWKHSNGATFVVRGSHEYFYALHKGKDLAVFKRPTGEANSAFMYALTFKQGTNSGSSPPDSPSTPPPATIITPTSYPFQAVGRHYCPCTGGEHAGQDDIYDATYSFQDEQEFSLRFIVNGPAKAQLINTHFKKVPTSEQPKVAETTLKG